MEKLVKKFINPCNDFGIKHNEILKLGLDHVDEEQDHEKAAIKATKFLEEYFDMKIPHEIVESNFKLSDDLFEEMEDTDKISPQLLHYYKELYGKISIAKDLEEIIHSINMLEYEAETLFKGDELEIFYMALAIAKHSAKFWAPKEQGGEDGMKFRYAIEERMGYPVSKSPDVDFMRYAEAGALGFMFGTPFGVPFCGAVYGSLLDALAR